jgi:pectinesterase inhibitor-like protein
MAMTAATATASILLFALFFAGAHAEPAEIPCALPACKTVGGGSQFFDVQFCLAALGSDGRSISHCMDYQAYSVIATDLLAANVTATAAKIDGLLRESASGGSRDDGGVDEATTRCLRSCQALYGGTVRRQPGCVAAVRGVRKGEATRCLEEAAAAAKQCEDGFRNSKAASPVTAENQNAFMLAKLAVALLGEVYTNK